MRQALDNVREFAQQLSVNEVRGIETLVVILVMAVLRWAALHVVNRRTSDAKLRYHWTKTVSYTTGIFAILLIARIWFPGFRTIATFLGLVAAGLAVALKDPIQNLAGWIFLVWRRPFVVGDRIQIADHAGDVVDQRLFQFTLLEIGNWVDADQSTGRLIHVPNGRVFIDPVANYTRGFPYIWNEIAVTVTFESDWEAAKRILLDIAQRHGTQFTKEAAQDVQATSSRFLIYYSTLQPTVYTTVRDHGVRLTIRYICDARRRRDTTQAIWEDILRELRPHGDIAFAYPTQRFFDNAAEGKSSLRPAQIE